MNAKRHFDLSPAQISATQWAESQRATAKMLQEISEAEKRLGDQEAVPDGGHYASALKEASTEAFGQPPVDAEINPYLITELRLFLNELKGDRDSALAVPAWSFKNAVAVSMTDTVSAFESRLEGLGDDALAGEVGQALDRFVQAIVRKFPEGENLFPAT